MPTIRQSGRPNIEGWQQVKNASAAAEKPSSPPEPDPTARSTYMTASMPLMASTGDAFARQFYANNGLPQTRILPAKRGGGA